MGKLEILWVIVKLDRLSVPWHRGDLHRLSGRDEPRSVDAPDVLRRILRRVSAYFDVAVMPNYLAPHLQLALIQSQTLNPLDIRVEKPTLEERHEAEVFWRNWQAVHPPKN